MKKTSFIASTALGVVLGAVLFNAPHAYAQLATIDVASIAQQIKSFAQETGILDVLNAMNTVQTTISSTMNDINKAIGPTTYGAAGVYAKCKLLESPGRRLATDHRRFERRKFPVPDAGATSADPGRAHSQPEQLHGTRWRRQRDGCRSAGLQRVMDDRRHA